MARLWDADPEMMTFGRRMNGGVAVIGMDLSGPLGVKLPTAVSLGPDERPVVMPGV